MTTIDIRPLTVARIDDYLAFFDARAFTDNPRWASCYCFFPFHDPKLTRWAKRGAQENREAICARVAAGQAPGYLAYAGNDVIGWCNAGPCRDYPMLDDEPDFDDPSTGVIFCFIVAPAHRGQGVATALLRAACDGLRAQGLQRVQARPRRTAGTAAENHLGPLAMYVAAGFTIVGEDGEGNVTVRKSLVP